VVLMAINRPMCKDDIRVLSLKNLAIRVITPVCDFDFSIDLAYKDGLRA